jgi:peptidoglycan/LPS O-acetylase OafA/YrhL
LVFATVFLVGFFTVPFAKTLTSICSALLIVSVSHFKTGLYDFLNRRFLIYIGILSYSIYIWQELFFANELGFWTLIPVNLLCIFIVANISFYLVEKPILRLKSRFVNVSKEPVNRQIEYAVKADI